MSNRQIPDDLIHSVFVYGTLKHDQLRGGMWPRSPRSIRKALIRASLYDLGAYPAIAEGDDWVLGEVWCFDSSDMPATLATLDAIEGYRSDDPNSEYQRVVIRAALLSGSSSAHITSGIAEDESVDCFTYKLGRPQVRSRIRRIEPWLTEDEIRVAQWPDKLSRVPKSISEE